MVRYIRVKRGTRLYDSLVLAEKDIDKVIENKDRIEKIIGCSMKDNLAGSTDLQLLKVPEELKNQFKKNPNGYGYYEVKVRSQVKKDWDAFVKETGVQFMDLMTVIRMYGLVPQFRQPRFHHFHAMDDDFYFTAYEKDDKNELLHKDMEFISELDYMKIRTDYLNRNPEEGVA
ncbi:hypothetical protein ACTFR8_24020 [Bacillus cereus group sp. MYBK15-3]|uniref:hypothetical protein n=1 Tax=unclassified Bacillus cereus group TaxID=2750818 RepID=UPI003F7A6017